jgi:hypothetical protein
MQRENPHQLFHQPNQADAIEKLIKTEFYNSVATIVFSGGYTRETLQQKLRSGIIQYIRTLLQRSVNSSGIKLEMGTVVTLQICPARYQQLFGALLALKRDMSRIDEIVNGIMSLDSFQEINPSNSLLAMGGFISSEQIRESFYNLMFEQTLTAVIDGWIPQEDIEEQDSDIYLSLPALTLFETLLRSRRSHGIALIDGGIVTLENCPITEGFPILVQHLLAIKEQVYKLIPAQIDIVKNGLSCKKPLSEESELLKTDECNALIGMINGLSIQISQREAFKNMAQEVWDVYLGKAKPATPAIKP